MIALPLLVVAAVIELVVLVFGWRYEAHVCTPPGLAITFLGLAPVGVLIILLHALKLPLAVWASLRQGVFKWMAWLLVLPFMSLMSFELVMGMSRYEQTMVTRPAQILFDQANQAESAGDHTQADSLYLDGIRSLENTQVYRLSVAVHQLKGATPQAANLSPKARSLALRDQINLVGITIYPLFAFFASFLPTLAMIIGVLLLKRKKEASAPLAA